MASPSIAAQCFKIVPDCPKEGVTFYDMAPLLASASLRKRVTSELKSRVEVLAPTLIVALETRGYFIGSWIADALGLPLLALRKTANALKAAPIEKLVVQTFDVEYKKGESIALPVGCIPAGSRVLIVDDVLATGGTVEAAALLTKRVQPDSTVVGAAVLLELLGLRRGTDTWLPLVTLFNCDTHQNPPVLFDAASGHRETIPAERIRADDARAALIWHPSMDSIANELLSTMPHQLRASPVRWESFPDGWPNVHFEHRSTLTGRDVVFLASFHDKNLIMEQISLMIALPRQVIKSLRVLIPYFGPGTMERVSVEGELATAETLAKMCSTCLPSTQGGPPILTFIDIHALCERFYFDDRATVVFASALPLIKRKIISNRMTIVFPDEGAFKRFAPDFKGQCPMVVCSKVRGEGDARKVTISQEFLSHSYGPGIDPYKQPAIILDDLVQSGATLAECAVALRAAYPFPSISAYVTHAVFPNNAHLRFATGDGRKIFDTFYVTDTNPTVAQKLAVIGAPFSVLHIAPLLRSSLSNVLPVHTLHEDQNVSLVLCSQSELKRTAVTQALDISAVDHIHLADTAKVSGKRNQPIGTEDIVTCAVDRILQAIGSHIFAPLALETPLLWYMAIESGIACVDSRNNRWQEVTCIAIAKNVTDVLYKDPLPELVWVYGPMLDTPRYAPLVEKVIAAQGMVTLGELLHAEDPSVPADAWYDRQECITEGLVNWLKTV